MKNLIAKLLVFIGVAFAPSMALAAPDPIALEGGVRVEKTVVENGQSRVVLSKPDVVVPGDRLLFTTHYANGGGEAVKNFVVTNPLPAAVELAPDAVGSNEVSVDGGKTFGSLATMTVAAADGSRRAAAASDVTHIRWTIPVIAAGASGEVEYHAIVR